MHPEGDLFDERIVAELRSIPGEEGGSLFDELAASFRETVVTEDEKLARAIPAGDTKEAARAAHRLVGAAAAIGALALSRAAASLERACHDAPDGPKDVLVAEVRAAAAAALRFVETPKPPVK